MAKISKKELIRAAFRARQRAVAPYSKFKVGAALHTGFSGLGGGQPVAPPDKGIYRPGLVARRFRELP